eukprot:1372941-Amorphochlora_amoeboformis.AAC.1
MVSGDSSPAKSEGLTTPLSPPPLIFELGEGKLSERGGRVNLKGKFIRGCFVIDLLREKPKPKSPSHDLMRNLTVTQTPQREPISRSLTLNQMIDPPNLNPNPTITKSPNLNPHHPFNPSVTVRTSTVANPNLPCLLSSKLTLN